MPCLRQVYFFSIPLTTCLTSGSDEPTTSGEFFREILSIALCSFAVSTQLNSPIPLIQPSLSLVLTKRIQRAAYMRPNSCQFTGVLKISAGFCSFRFPSFALCWYIIHATLSFTRCTGVSRQGGTMFPVFQPKKGIRDI